MSKRGNDWKRFADEVYFHIENYTVPQYGDDGEDQITYYGADECVTHIKKYAGRFGNNQREGQELLDFMKIAHYAQCARDKVVAGNVKGQTSKLSLITHGQIAADELPKFLEERGLTKKNIKITIEPV